MWFGLSKNKKDFLKGLPGGYDLPPQLQGTSIFNQPIPPNMVQISRINKLWGSIYEVRINFDHTRFMKYYLWTGVVGIVINRDILSR